MNARRDPRPRSTAFRMRGLVVMLCAVGFPYPIECHGQNTSVDAPKPLHGHPMSAPSATRSDAPATDSLGAMPLRMPREEGDSPRKAGLDPTGRVIMSLAVVLGVFFLVAWFGRNRSRAVGELPAEVVEVLGDVPIGKHTGQLVRMGNKLLLLSVSSHGLAPLAEITDPAEVDRLTELCDVMQGRTSARPHRTRRAA